MTATLLLVNGPPGVGKSTLAQRYVDEHPLALLLDIDAVRTSLGRWQDVDESKLEARRLALAMADAHLRAGHDVVVPQYLGRIEFIETLDDLARRCDARFVEVLVVDAPDAVTARFRRRRAELRASGHAHPQLDVDDSRVPDAIADAFTRLEAIRRQRPRTIVAAPDVPISELRGDTGAMAPVSTPHSPVEQHGGMPITEMSVESTPIEGLHVIRMKQVEDERGTVREFYRESSWKEAGLPSLGHWLQINVTESKQGAVRGLHGESMHKLVAIAAGEAFGAYVDARPDSPTYKTTFTTRLVPGMQLLIPNGVCNGFQSVSEGVTQYLYCFDHEWVPGMAGTAVNPLDPALSIEWPLPVDRDDRASISAKDDSLPPLG